MSARPISLGPLEELQLEQAFARLDFDAIMALFEAEVRKQEDLENKVYSLEDDVKNVLERADGLEVQMDEAAAERDKTEKEAKALEKKLDDIYELVEPLIKKKTRVKLLQEIWEVVKP